MTKPLRVDREPRSFPGSDETPASTLIAPDDDMLFGDPGHYFGVGREALSVVRDACALAGIERLETILDFPCGYGRVARWLRAGFPGARLCVSDTHAPAVAFCVEHFSASGVVAAVDGAHWAALQGPFDVIWCGSLLTHFDHDRWAGLLQRFAERVSARGVIVFTTHGGTSLRWLRSGTMNYGLPPDAVAQLCAGVESGGFGYVDYPGAPRYGVSVVQPQWVRDLVARDTDLEIRELREAGWDHHHDVVFCVRRGTSRGP